MEVGRNAFHGRLRLARPKLQPNCIFFLAAGLGAFWVGAQAIQFLTFAGAGQVETVYANTGARVNLVALSEGPQLVLSFLHRMSQAWKNKYVSYFVAASPVWSGCPG